MHRGSLAAGHIILGFEPIIGTDGDCTAAVLRTGNFLERWPIADTTGEDATPVRLIECSKSHTIVCASKGVAVMADASHTDIAMLVRFNPRGSPTDVSEPTTVPESSALLTAAVTPDAALLVGGTRSGHVKVWSITLGDNGGSGTLLHTFEDRHDSWVSCVATNTISSGRVEKFPDAKYAVVTGSWYGTAIAHFIGEDSFVSLRLVRENLCDDSMASDEHTVTCADVSPDGSLAVLGYRSGEVVLWDIGNGQELYCLRGTQCEFRPSFEDHPDPVSAVLFNQARHWVLIARQNMTIEVVDLKSKSSVCSLYAGPRQRRGGGLKSTRCTSWIGDTANLLASWDSYFEKFEIRRGG